MILRLVAKYFALLGLVLVLCMVQGLANPPVYSFSGSLQIEIALDTADCHLLPIGYTDLRYEIPTEWRVWDSTSDNDGKLEAGELIDTGWLPVATFIAFIATVDDSSITVPSGWSGEISFQARMTRHRLGDSAGDYDLERLRKWQ